jgi:hypothetical protein
VSIQQDFGGFDPSFLGVTLRFGNERAFNFYKAYAASENPLPVSHLSSDERFEALSITSVMAHETRHFHDFFLTPYSARVFGKRVRMLAELLQMLPHLVRDGPNCMPVPLVKWCALNEQQRATQLQWLPPLPDGVSWIPVDVPYMEIGATMPADAMGQLLWATFRLRNEITDLAFQPAGHANGQTIQPWQIFELPAILVQINEILWTYGETQAGFYVSYLEQAESNPYTTMLRRTRKLWDDRDRLMDTTIANAMAAWSLLGSYAKDQWKACPTERYAALWLHLKATGIPEWNDNAGELFQAWSTALHLSTVQDGMNEARQSYANTQIAIDSKADQLASILGSDYSSLLQRLTSGVSQASQHMVDAVAGDLNAYIATDAYTHSVHRYVNPLLRKIYDGGMLAGLSAEEASREPGNVIEWAYEQDGRLLVESRVEPYNVSPHTFVTAEDALEFSRLSALGDFLISDTDRMNLDVQRTASVFFRDSHLRPFEVFV